VNDLYNKIGKNGSVSDFFAKSSYNVVVKYDVPVGIDVDKPQFVEVRQIFAVKLMYNDLHVSDGEDAKLEISPYTKRSEK